MRSNLFSWRAPELKSLQDIWIPMCPDTRSTRRVRQACGFAPGGEVGVLLARLLGALTRLVSCCRTSPRFSASRASSRPSHPGCLGAVCAAAHPGPKPSTSSHLQRSMTAGAPPCVVASRMEHWGHPPAMRSFQLRASADHPLRPIR
jgi:hypothetical protein